MSRPSLYLPESLPGSQLQPSSAAQRVVTVNVHKEGSQEPAYFLPKPAGEIIEVLQQRYGIGDLRLGHIIVTPSDMLSDANSYTFIVDSAGMICFSLSYMHWRWLSDMHDLVLMDHADLAFVP